MNPKDPVYERRIRSQIAQYANPEGLVKLGPIYSYWMRKHIRPRISAVFGVSHALPFYAHFAKEALRQPGSGRRIVSLGAGDCVFEVAIIKKLLEMGETDFVVEAIELSPLRFDRARTNAVNEGVEQYLVFSEGDLNTWTPLGKYSAVIAKDALHHVLALEHLFEVIHEALEETGLFLTTDTIGRNGHMRWPEADHDLWSHDATKAECAAASLLSALDAFILYSCRRPEGRRFKAINRGEAKHSILPSRRTTLGLLGSTAIEVLSILHSSTIVLSLFFQVRL